MAQTPNVHEGGWTDHDHTKFWQSVWTFSESKAGAFASVLAVIITLASLRLYAMFIRLLDGIWSYKMRHREHQTRQAGEQNEGTPLLTTNLSQRHYSGVRRTIKATKSPESTAARMVVRAIGNYNSSRSLREATVMMALAVVCTAIFLVIAVVGIVSSRIATDSVVLSESKDCGLWELDPHTPLRLNISSFAYRQEADSGDYARRCYNVKPNTDGCNFFLTPDIPSVEIENVACPFAEGFCLEGPSSAYTLTTGLVDSRKLGINVPTGYLFNRTTTCAPVKRMGYIGLNDGLIEYYYGQIAGRNQTWVSPQYKQLTIPGYDVATFCNVDETRSWQPIPELNPTGESLVTLLIVSSQRNFHTEKRYDPIFPATREMVAKGIPFYYNDDPISTILACKDETTVCDASGKTCWNVINQPTRESPQHIEKIGYYMLDLALRRSRICHSIKFRGGNALNAQSRLYTFLSLPLAKSQWKVEAATLFRASLARIQIDLSDFVRGNAAHEVGYVDRMDSGFQEMCTTYKFKGNGWKNISKGGFTLFISLAVAIIIFSLQIPVHRQDGSREDGKGDGGGNPDTSSQPSASQDGNNQDGSRGDDRSHGSSSSPYETGQSSASQDGDNQDGNGQGANGQNTTAQITTVQNNSQPKNSSTHIDGGDLNESDEIMLIEILVIFLWTYIKAFASTALRGFKMLRACCGTRDPAPQEQSPV